MQPRLTFITFGVLLLLSCSESERKAPPARDLLNLGSLDTLILGAFFSDCGEWGGHTEVMRIFRRDRTLWIVYERDTVNCPDPALFNRRIVEQKENQLTHEQGKKVVAYVQAFERLTSKGDAFGNAANVFTVSRKDKGLEFEYLNASRDWNGFDDLKQTLVP